MNKTIFFLISIFLFASGALFPQQANQLISVQSFRALPNDMDARIAHSKIDQNGEKCAIIKVVTTEIGFVWEGGTLGIVAAVNKSGEYWLYVPYGAKKLTIKHQKLGVLRNYIYPERIKEAYVYEMILETGKVKTFIEEKIAKEWITIVSNPEGADVFINNQLVGKTPLQQELIEGDYSYKISKEMYYADSGQFNLNLKEGKVNLTIDLKPNFGYARITTNPEDEAIIFIDGRETGKTTPGTIGPLITGEHTLKVSTEYYYDTTFAISIQTMKTINIVVTLKPAYGIVTITTQPKAEIYVDTAIKGYGTWKGKLNIGEHTFKAKLNDQTLVLKESKIQNGENEITLFQKLKHSTLNLNISPIKVQVEIDDLSYKTNSVIINDIIVGRHSLKLSKKGYHTIIKDIIIKENQVTEENITLLKGSDMNGKYLDTRDSNIYEFVKIKNQIWLTENLNYNTNIGSWCYEDNISNCNNYGRLYDWETALNVCPTGWHLPSMSEWTILIDNFGGKEIAGEKLKSTNTWKTANSKITNKSGFKVLPGGMRNSESYNGSGEFTLLWSADEKDDQAARYLLLQNNKLIVEAFGQKSLGSSVRCVKD
ncbi:FISUMP domain-containing protein [Bacteroidota bacterium]